MKISVCIQTDDVPKTLPVALIEGTFEEKVKKAAIYGFDGVELMPCNPQSLDVNFIDAQIWQSGMEVAAIGTGALSPVLGLTLLSRDPKISELAFSRLLEVIEFAEKVGSPLVTIGSFRGRLEWGGHSALSVLIEMLKRAGEFACQKGLKLAIEPITHFNSDLINNIDDGLRFIKQVGHPSVGLMLDTYHMNMEECSLTEPFKRLQAENLLLHIHVGDNNRLPPGKGVINFPEIIETLKQIGYDGYLSAELFPVPTPDRAAQDTAEYLGSLIRTK